MGIGSRQVGGATIYECRDGRWLCGNHYVEAGRPEIKGDWPTVGPACLSCDHCMGRGNLYQRSEGGGVPEYILDEDGSPKANPKWSEEGGGD